MTEPAVVPRTRPRDTGRFIVILARAARVLGQRDTQKGVVVALLEVSDLQVSFSTPDGRLDAVRGLSFSVEQGRTLGIVGESGSGKSVSTQAIMGLVRGARISGQALFEGNDLLTMDSESLRKIRGDQIGMIFQDPLSSLHPYYRVGWQIIEMIRAHDTSISKAKRAGTRGGGC